MKSVNDNSNGSNNDNNWLGFSLSPHMKMDVTSEPQHHVIHHHQYNHQTQVPTSFYLSPSHLNTSPICYGVGENGGFHSSFSLMPLKSDGSLQLMEALTRSQPKGMVLNSSPKLEDFLGGEQYGSHERESMALSLDSMYYSGLPCHNIYQTSPEEQTKHNHLTNSLSHIPPLSANELPCLKNWVTGPYSGHHTLDQQINISMIENRGGSGSIGPMGCGDLQSLSLSMSPGSQSSCVTASRQISPSGTECLAIETKKKGSGKIAQKQPVHRKSIDTFGHRTSRYRGVTRHRWTGRYEAHLWDNSCKREGQTRKGRQVYLGGYDMEEKAARAYDCAALKYWGPSTHINFPLEDYQQHLEEMKNMNRQEYVAHLRRKSSGFSRGASMYRGVTRHHQHGRWQARIGRVAGNKDLYLGTFSTQEEAAEAYDIAAIKFRGANAVTNFDIKRYDVEKITASNTLIAGDIARRNNEREATTVAVEYNPMVQNRDEHVHVQSENNGNGPNWKMVLSESQQQNACVESIQEKTMRVGHYRNSSFSMALQVLIGSDSVNSNHLIVDESAKMGTHLSNPSSLVTNLSSSREASPDKTGASMLFCKPNLTNKFMDGPTSGVGSWISSAQLRSPSISMAHLPVFAAWNDI